LALLVNDRLELILADALVSVTHGDESLVVYGQFKLLDVGRVGDEVCADVFFNAFDIFPKENVAVLVSSHNYVA